MFGRFPPVHFFLLCLCFLLTSTKLLQALSTDDNARMLRCWVDNLLQVEALTQMQRDNQLEFWQPPKVGQISVVMVSERHFAFVMRMFRQLRLVWFPMTPDVRWELHKEAVENDRDREWDRLLNEQAADPVNTPRTHYADLEEMNTWMRRLSEVYGPQWVSVVNIGKTIENREMKVLRVGDPSKPVIFLEAGIHAREWITSASVIYVIDRLLRTHVHSKLSLLHEKKKQLYPNGTDWLQCFQLQTILVANPDGYAFTWKNKETLGRFWRKNRHIQPQERREHQGKSKLCRGVDLNRNFDANFPKPENLPDCHEPIFSGAHAFSELESQHLRDYVLQVGARLQVYISVHSYGQYFIEPYAFKHAPPMPQRKVIHNLLKEITETIQRRYHTQFKFGSLYAWQQIWAAGASTDWMLLHARMPYAFAVELMPKGELKNNGFDPHPYFIPLSGQHLFTAVELSAKRLLQCH